MEDFKKSHFLYYGHPQQQQQQHTKTLCQHLETLQSGNVHIFRKPLQRLVDTAF
jgi:hypothetical protein